MKTRLTAWVIECLCVAGMAIVCVGVLLAIVTILSALLGI